MFSSLGLIDELVLLALLLCSILIGVRAGRSNTTVDVYLLGGRSLPWWAILGSIVATETSTVTVLSVPGEAYGSVGMKWLQLPLGYIVGRAIVIAILLPRYFQGSLFTAYEVLEMRFGAATRRASSALFLVTRNLGDGLRLFLAGLVLQTLLGWSFASSIVVMGVVTIIYTVVGGLRSVVWNDCIQFVIYMLGGIAAVFVLAGKIPGGFEEAISYGSAQNKLNPFDFHFQLSNPYTFWAGLIGGAVLTIGTHGTDHMMVQRYLSAKNLKDAGKAIFASGIVVFIQFALFLFIGIELACFHSQPGNTAPDKPDQVFMHFIVNDFPANAGLIGLMFAAVLSAAMSTLSSSLNASASAVLNDFWIPLSAQKPTDKQQLRISHGLTLFFGIVQMIVGIFASQLSMTVVKGALTIAGFSAGLLLGIFLLGVFSKKAGQAAALIGSIVGLLVLLIVQFGLPKNWAVAWPWLALIGASVTWTVGEVTSILIPQKPGGTPTAS